MSTVGARAGAVEKHSLQLDGRPNSNGSYGSWDAGVSKLGAGADENSLFSLSGGPNDYVLSVVGMLEMEKSLYILVIVAVLIWNLRSVKSWCKCWWVMIGYK